MQSSVRNIVWTGGIAVILILMGAANSGCNARDAAASAPAAAVYTKAQVDRGAYLVNSGVCNNPGLNVI